MLAHDAAINSAGVAKWWTLTFWSLPHLLAGLFLQRETLSSTVWLFWGTICKGEQLKYWILSLWLSGFKIMRRFPDMIKKWSNRVLVSTLKFPRGEHGPHLCQKFKTVHYQLCLVGEEKQRYKCTLGPSVSLRTSSASRPFFLLWTSPSQF